MNFDGRHRGVLGVPCVEGVEPAVLGDDREVRFALEIPHGGLHAHDVSGPCGLSRYDLRGADVDVGHGGGKEDMQRFGKCDLYALRRKVGLCPNGCRQQKCERQDVWESVVFHCYSFEINNIR